MDIKIVNNNLILMFFSANPNEIPNYPRCKSDEFTCNDGACIPNSYYCNNRPDCLDNSDEVNCRGKSNLSS